MLGLALSSYFVDLPAPGQPEAVLLVLAPAPSRGSVVAFARGSGAVGWAAVVGSAVGSEPVSAVRVADQIAEAVAEAAAVVVVGLVAALAEAEEMHGGSWLMEGEEGPAEVVRSREVLDLRFGCDCSVANVHAAW